VRDAVGLTPRTLTRRWATVDRLALVTVRRDGFATTPGPSLTVSLAERTRYRAAAWVLDRFDRATLGAAYGTWATSPPIDDVAIDGGAIVPAGLGATLERFTTHRAVLPREQWAEITIAALDSQDSGGYASVGVLLRGSPPSGTGRGYLAVAAMADGVGSTRLGRFRGLTLEWLEETPTAWRAGDVLRAEADYTVLRVRRNGTLILEHVDEYEPLLVGGRAGVEAQRALETDAARLTDFVAGPLRQEYLGQILELGDVMTSLGTLEPTAQPATVEATLVNLAPIGGKARLAALIRHGLNRAGAYEIHRAGLRVLTALAGASAPLASSRGLVVDGVALMTEDRVRITARGLDGFLEPRIAAGPVIYLASAPPVSGPPALPDDPCEEPPEPEVIPGDEPDEPPDEGSLPDEGEFPAEDVPGDLPEDFGRPGDEAPPGDLGGPEAPPGVGGGDEEEEEAEPGGDEPPLAGTWKVTFDYTLSVGGGPMGEDVYVGSTTAEQLEPPDEHDFFTHQVVYKRGAGSEAFPEKWFEVWMYRGPDIGGTDLIACQAGGCSAEMNRDLYASAADDAGGERGFEVKFARYTATAIHTQADLEALRPKDPGALEETLPERIETLATWPINLVEVGGGPSVAGVVLDSVVPMNQAVGPQLTRVEFPASWFGGSDPPFGVTASLITRRTTDLLPLGVASLT
jgi:hypothetical protein